MYNKNIGGTIKMIIKRISYVILPIYFFSICSCTINHSYSSSINNVSESNSNKELSNNTNNSITNDIAIEVILRHDFYLNDVHYVLNLEKELSYDNSYNLLGYFVNACDLEYWKSYDNNPYLVYAVEENSTLVRNNSNENLKNRFELYSIDMPNAIGLRNNRIHIYEREDK
jgi:hypothetical protein